MLAIGVVLLLVSYSMRLWERRQRRKEADMFFDKYFKDDTTDKGKGNDD